MQPGISTLVREWRPHRVALGGIAYTSGTTAATLTASLALPPLLAAPADVPRSAAGMFTISYATAIIIPTLSGALWDATSRAWTIFVPLSLRPVTLTVLGAAVTRYKPRARPSAEFIADREPA